MITKESKVERICSFYVSDFHLEMIMLPYINRKINEDANIVIMTEKNLANTVEVVVSKINLPQERKEKLLKLDWNQNDCEKFKIIRNKQCENKLIVFVIGNENYIENVNKNISSTVNECGATIVDCYDLKDVENKFQDVLKRHSKVLNTLEEVVINS